MFTLQMFTLLTVCFYLPKPSAMLRMRQVCFHFLKIGMRGAIIEAILNFQQGWFNRAFFFNLSESPFGRINPFMNDMRGFRKPFSTRS